MLKLCRISREGLDNLDGDDESGGVEIPWMQTASKRRRYLVGVSGGADSVAMLHLLMEAGFEDLVVCHLNHRLRGRESLADQKSVEKLAKQLNLVCEVGVADVKGRMKSEGESMETAARHARHEFFADCARKHRCPRLLLAHHADDQAETVLWNLLRGSYGLRGMRESQEIQVGRKILSVMRPLLACRHDELVEWLKSHGLTWREDASNAEAVAVRNRLRNEAIPLLTEISGRDVVDALVKLESDFSEWRDAQNQLVEDLNVVDPQGRLHVPTVRKLSESLQKVAIRNYLTEKGISAIDRSLLDRAVAMLDVANPSAVNLPGGSVLRRRAGRIFVDLAR